MVVIETERLVIRFLTAEDAEFILTLVNEPSFISNIGDRGIRTLEQASNYLLDGPITSYERNGHGLYAVELRESRDRIGMCGLLRRPLFDDIDLGYALLPEYWSRGLAHEAATAVLEFGHSTLGAARILGLVSPNNIPSIRLLEKMGFDFVELRQMKPGEGLPTAIYAHCIRTELHKPPT